MSSSSPQSAPYPRVGTRDLIPILVTGLVGAALIIASDRVAAAIGTTPDGQRALSLLWATALGLGLSLALAGMQGRATDLTLKSAVLAWIKLAVVATVVALATGRLVPGVGILRLILILVASLGASLLLFFLRKRQG